MTTNNDDVRLLVNGKEFRGWKEVGISAGIERAARDFTLAITDRWPATGAAPVREVKPGDVCEVYIGTDKVLTGYVDGTPVSYDARSVSVSVRGRSKTADLVDCCSPKSGQWRAQTVQSIATALAKPYGIAVKSQVPTGTAVSDFQIQQGETIFEALDRLLKPRQIWATDDADGNLVFLKIGAGGWAGADLVLGDNILAANAELDNKDRFSKYICNGQRAGDDLDYGTVVNEIVATQTDATVHRNRVLVLSHIGHATQALCQARVEFEAVYRFARSVATTYTVQGWRTASGALWMPNQTVRVVDRVMGFDDELLIVEVEYRLTNEGQRAVLKVAPRAGYVDRDPVVHKRKGKDSTQDTDDAEIWATPSGK